MVVVVLLYYDSISRLSFPVKVGAFRRFVILFVGAFLFCLHSAVLLETGRQVDNSHKLTIVTIPVPVSDPSLTTCFERLLLA